MDLGILTPLQIPGTDPSFTAFNNLNISSTLQDFINCIATPGSLFDGNVRLEIADGISNSAEADKNKKLVLIETSGLVADDTLEALKLPVELNKVFTALGLKSGGNLVNLPNSTDVGITGAQITGLGYDLKADINPQGSFSIKSLDPTRKGRLYVAEGRGTTASDLKILAGSGAIGNGTEAISSGDLNPGANRNSLLSELIPKTSGSITSFDAILRDIYIENGMDAAQIDFLQDPPLNLQTPLKALNNGSIDINTGVYQGGIDVGRPASGFEIEDQFGNKAIVDLSNNLSVSSYKTYPDSPPYPTATEIGQYLFKPVTDLSASAVVGGGTRFSGNAGNFSEFQIGDFFEIAEDQNIDGIGQPQSSFEKYRITNMAADGSWIEFAADSSNFDLTPDNPGNNNYSVNVFPAMENLYAKMETEYVNKPFYSPDSNISDLQMALNIAIDKAQRTTGFGVEQIVLDSTPESNTLLMHVYGDNGPTVTINERDINADGKKDSSTAGDLKLLREVGARGNGSPLVESGHLSVSPTLSYLLDTINNPLSGVKVTASIGNNGSGPTIDISSNTNSSYIKIRDTFEGNSASQTGLAATRSLFQTMIDFRDALYRNDTNYISQQTLQHIGKDEEKILEYRAQIGSVVNRFETNMERLESTKIEQTTRFSEHQDLNLSDAIIELRQLELMQRAALNVGSRIFQQSLMDFLR
jgi:flagellin-like hook-associated protein FlgL